MNKPGEKASRRIDLTGDQPLQKSSATADANAAKARVIALSSGKGGVGKSTLSVNLCVALAQQGQRVCLFDADTNLANVNILMGLSPRFTLQEFLNGERSIDEILIEGPAGVSIVPAASGIAEFIHLSDTQQKNLLAALQELEQRFDYLIIDTAAGIHDQVIQFLLAAPYTILVITPDPTSLTDAFSLLKVLKRYFFDHQVHVIVNMVSGLPAAHDVYKRFTLAAAKFLQLEIRYLGYVLTDQQLGESVRRQQPLQLYRPAAIASRCVYAISNRLRQVFSGEPADREGFSGFFQQQLYPQPIDEHDAGQTTAAVSGDSQPQLENSGDQVAGLLAGVYYATLLGARERSENS
jgi:flagellar biosynthesis protein FlhG